MNELSSEDIHEMCDTVQASVVNIVRQNLSQTKPGFNIQTMKWAIFI